MVLHFVCESTLHTSTKTITIYKTHNKYSVRSSKKTLQQDGTIKQGFYKKKNIEMIKRAKT